MAITAYFLDRNWDYREVLLRFELLSGTHSGPNLGQVVVRTLQQHQVLGRVLAVTTDNASNNTTLMAVVNDTVQALKLSTDSAIIQVPCIAHVIQISLNDLLGKIKASPKNDIAELVWNEDRVRNLRARQQKQEIADTLNKVSSLTI
jgi:RNase P/RNase MRP subunit p29